MKLIPNWRRAHRMFCVQAMSAAAAIQGAWMALPDDMRAELPEGTASYVALTVLVLLAVGLGGRLVEQPALHAEPRK